LAKRSSCHDLFQETWPGNLTAIFRYCNGMKE